jgi:hypothetical protein
LAAALIALAGGWLRIAPSSGFHRPVGDALLYRDYVHALDAGGPGGYPAASAAYIERGKRPELAAELPPTRILYVFCAWGWKRVEFGRTGPADLFQPGGAQRDPALVSLRSVSCLFSILLMLLCGVAAARMTDRTAGLAVLALIAFAPLEIHMGQQPLIDGFFAFWAMATLWTLWECLRRPGHAGWLTAYGLSLAAMVMTKENAFFVYVALAGIVAANRWARFGRVTRPLLLVTLAAPALAVGVLVALAGGVGNFIEVYRILVSKGVQLPYAIASQDGPWQRYLIDLLLLSPVTFILALGGMFGVSKETRAPLFLLLFVAVSYLLMGNVRYGLNLRFATIWDLPLAIFAWTQIGRLAERAGERRAMAAAALVAVVCACELRQYVVYFMDGRLFDVPTAALERTTGILK